MEHLDRIQLARQPVGELARAVRRVVVDDEHAVVGAEHLTERAHHRLEILALVVGRQADALARSRLAPARARAVSHRVSGQVAATLPRNDELADQLELLADLSELEGEDSFRVLAYRRAATRIRETGGPVAQLALEGKAKELSGIGKTIEEKIVQVVETGEMDALTKRKAIVPEEVVKFMRLPGLGPKTARRIWKELGVTTIAELKEAAEQQRLRVLTGLGAKSEEKILAALAEEPKDPRESRRLLGDGLPVLLELVEELRRASRRGQGVRGGLGAPPPRDLPRPRRDRDLDRRAGAARALHRAATTSPASSRRATRRRP